MTRSDQDPTGSPGPAGFLAEVPEDDTVARMYDGDRDGLGYVMNLTRLWAHDPEAQDAFFAVASAAAEHGGLTLRQRGVLVTATASTRGDSYCALAWGQKLAEEAGVDVAVAALAGADEDLDGPDAALATWARRVVDDPGATTAEDVQTLRDAGLSDRQVFCATLYVAVRLAFSTVNAALGARPDRDLVREVPEEVRDVVRWGRPVADAASLQ